MFANPRAAAALTVAAVTLSIGTVATIGRDADPASGRPVLAAATARPLAGQPAATAAVPSVTSVPGSVPDNPSGYDGVDAATIEAAGYTEHEFFIAGTAQAYRYLAAPGVDGRWQVGVEPNSAADYRTRLVVLTPKNPRRFSGTVVTEWNNVTGGYDAQPDLKFAHNTLFANGDAYVGVSAQFLGVAAARINDPERYASLVHPGDSYSYDIFSQAGMAVWRDPTVLGGLHPRVQIADGESQSAGRLEIYVDAVAPLVNVYNGFLVHSRGGSTFPLQQPPATATVVGPTGAVQLADGNAGLSQQVGPMYAKSRTDLATPVLYAMTESDVFSAPDGALDYSPATQPDSASFRLWELAGTSHIDDYVGFVTRSDTGTVASARTTFDAMLHPRTSSTQPGVFNFSCDQPINTGEHTYVFSAALVQLERWVRTGIPAAAPPLFAGQRPGLPTGTPAQRDAHGIVLGGVRNPSVDVPVATLTGRANTPSTSACVLLGTTTPFSTDQLKSLYPSHKTFVTKWTKSVRALTNAGYLTRQDAATLIAAATHSPVPH